MAGGRFAAAELLSSRIIHTREIGVVKERMICRRRYLAGAICVLWRSSMLVAVLNVDGALIDLVDLAATIIVGHDGEDNLIFRACCVIMTDRYLRIGIWAKPGMPLSCLVCWYSVIPPSRLARPL